MGIEIERKFLLSPHTTLADFTRGYEDTAEHYLQGYLDKGTVRIRIVNNNKEGESAAAAVLTIKGPASKGGLSRSEFEYSVPYEEGVQIFDLCSTSIEKTRYFVPGPLGLTFEVDVFAGPLRGLVVVEVEIPSEDFFFPKPSSLGKEVTGDKRYTNASLAKKKRIPNQNK